MAGNLASRFGRMLRPIRPGPQALASRRSAFAQAPETIAVESPAFEDGGPIPDRYTGYDDGFSPPLSWRNLPDAAASLVLLVEDADAPFLFPLVHLILTDIPPTSGSLAEGAIPASLRTPGPEGWKTGRNSLGRRGWMPIMPPPGHGTHRYAFQVFALAVKPALAWPPGREFLLRAVRPQVIARGSFVRFYMRK